MASQTLEEREGKFEGISKFKIHEIQVKGYEKVLKIVDEDSSLLAIISIHNTTLGRSLGGTRIYPYSSFDRALEDVLRLSKAMTYKAALAEVGFGGAKSVIIADPIKDKTTKLLLSFGRAVDNLRGEYICAEDVGCGIDDIKIINEATPFVVGLPYEKGGSGDPARYTAFGTFRGIQSVLKKIYGSGSVKGKKIALQGLGNVGMHLLDYLFWAGAVVYVTDIYAEKLSIASLKYKPTVVAAHDIYKLPCDVFTPCAMGGIINDTTLPLFNCKAIAGCANNQLLRDEHADLLRKRGILYAPDFVINAGGLLNVVGELEKDGYNSRRARDKIDSIYDKLLAIYDIAERKNISTHSAAMTLGDYKIQYAVDKKIAASYFPRRSE